MLVTIKHLPREAQSGVDDIYNDLELEGFVEMAIRNNDMIRVADMELPEEYDEATSENVLDIAFRLTNSIDYPWYLNKDLNVTEDAKEGCRSTSKGDIIMINGITYIVSSYGFIRMD